MTEQRTPEPEFMEISVEHYTELKQHADAREGWKIAAETGVETIRTLRSERDELKANADTVRELHQPIERADGQLICRLCGDMWRPCRTTQALNGNWSQA